jgi:predicted acetyltransferase
MPDPEITLFRADASRKLEFLEMALEFQADGDERHKPAIDDLDAYFERFEMLERGVNLAPGKVRCSHFWLERDGRILGQSSLRHELNDDLLLEGGHIGYNIRPTERLKGYGTLILKLTMDEARQIGLTRVMVTCDADNAGSRRIIEKNGGVFEGQGISKTSGKLVNRYWIELF